jgi:hypothetical protein
MQEERIKEDVLLVKLPNIIEEEDLGFKQCCEPELVLASGTNLSWKNDITPAWQKLNSPSDSATITLKKDGVETTFQPTTQFFPNDEYSVYAEIHWKEVLASEGVGCYTIHIDYEISGVTGSYVWGEYKLLPFTVLTAMGTARLRAVFNHYHEIEGINFKGANVNGTFRFYGKIDERQPNKYIDNLNDANRTVKSNVRENLNSYLMKTDPLKEKFTSKLTDLYLLSEVELYASDHNAHSHSYKTLDIPVTIDETDELEYKEFNRNANVNVTLVDRIKNKRTYVS